MTRPASWQNDPDCEHEVACAHQTHYCTYIRVPRLLSLRPPGSADELLLLTSLHWHELWFKVLLVDLRAALADDCTTYEPVKLLRRGVALFKLFAQHLDFAESFVVRELGLTMEVRAPGRGGASGQWAQLAALSRQLPRLGEPRLRPVAVASPGAAACARPSVWKGPRATRSTLGPRPTGGKQSATEHSARP